MAESRQLNGKKYSDKNRLDLFVKNACVLDKTLRLNGLGGATVLTNDSKVIENSLARIGYGLNIRKIPFSLDVPQGIRFYSAHFKIDVFNYLRGLSSEEYSILLDNDVVCLSDFSKEIYSVIKDGLPMIYYLPRYGGKEKIADARLIAPDLEWLLWCGGEFIGGRSAFFKSLYDNILKIKDNYWRVLDKLTFHIGDEVLTSIAMHNIICSRHQIVLDAGVLGLVHRYWSVFEQKPLRDVGTPLVHLPGDKVFISKIDLSGPTVEDLLSGYGLYNVLQRLKKTINDITIRVFKR